MAKKVAEVKKATEVKKEKKVISTVAEFQKEIMDTMKMRNYSKSQAERFMLTLLNDTELVSEDVKLSPSKEEKLKIKKKVVKDFRKALVKVLVKSGVDTKDAEAFVSKYHFTKGFAKTLYPLFSEFAYQWLKTGKKLALFNKDDVKASIYLKKREPIVKKREDGSQVEYSSFYSLGQSSGCPKHLKKITKSGKTVSMIFKEKIETLFED